MRKVTAPYMVDFDIHSINSWLKLPKNLIDNLNWSDYSYSPETSFQIAQNGETLFIHFEAKEEVPIRQENSNDQDPVYQDSCVEFFILDMVGAYHNFEFNAKGVLLSASGKSRKDRKPRNIKELQQIVRIPYEVEKVDNYYHWKLTIGIPFASVGLARGNSYRANFYKCGDLTEKRHYLSWNKIITQKPDFHRPEYFGLIDIE